MAEEASAERFSRLVCAGCGFVATEAGNLPLRCPRRRPGDGIDHLLTPALPAAALRSARRWEKVFEDPEPQPFLRFADLLHARRWARRHGMGDAAWKGLVEDLAGAVEAVDGRCLQATPCRPEDGLARRLGLAEGRLWVKDETGQVAGSHKVRHLFGVMLALQAKARLGGEPAEDAEAPLAIASCGNAALAAAVVARAASRRLRVFVPPDAHPRVLGRLGELAAELVACPREGSGKGDPCFRRFLEAVDAGSALPFTCQGSTCGLTLDGGKTLGWEVVAALRAAGCGLDRLFVQVGGGALASSTVLALEEAAELGLWEARPRIHPVQTAGAFPLWRAWDRLAAALGVEGGGVPDPRADARRAERLGELPAAEWEGALHRAAAHRQEYMWPWETSPRSLATGILDDETYDWLTVVRVTVKSGGWPLVVSEEQLAAAHRLGGEATAIPADPTGTSGLAGLLALRQAGGGEPDETIAVLFTGVER